MQESSIGVKIYDPFVICVLRILELRGANSDSKPLDNINEVRTILVQAWDMGHYSRGELPSDIVAYFIKKVEHGSDSLNPEGSQLKLSTMISYIRMTNIINLFKQ